MCIVRLVPVKLYHNQLEVLDVEKFSAVQFLRDGVVRMTFFDSDASDDVVQRGLSYGDTSLRVIHADSSIVSVHFRDLPVEVPDDDVDMLYASFGDVLSAFRPKHDTFQSLCDGNRILKDCVVPRYPVFFSSGWFSLSGLVPASTCSVFCLS